MNPFSRTELLLGAETLARLAAARVIVFGLGGVGSWCAEALVRSGVGSITLVDADTVDESNLNRQLPALTSTLGKPKAVVLAERFRQINPQARIESVVAFYDRENATDFVLTEYDVVIDAIDSLDSKAALIENATACGVALFSSMGAARRKDPSRVSVAEFWKVKGCALARALRQKFKRTGNFPSAKFCCVYSDEPLSGEPKGTSMVVTAAFGLRLAHLALEKLGV